MKIKQYTPINEEGLLDGYSTFIDYSFLDHILICCGYFKNKIKSNYWKYHYMTGRVKFMEYYINF